MRRICLLAILLVALFPLPPKAGGGSTPMCFGEAPTIVAERYSVRGTPGDDVIVDADGSGLIQAGRGDDRICASEDEFHELYGGAGADRIRGTGGEDIVYPQAGDDFVFVAGGDDLVTDESRFGDDHLAGGSGADTIRFSIPYSRADAAAVTVDLGDGRASGHGRDRLRAFEHVEGTAMPDRIIGDQAPNVLRGVRGGDTISGGGGDDTIYGATVRFAESGESIDRFDGADPVLRGGSGSDQIFGLSGDDRLFGGAGPDVLDGGKPHNGAGDRGLGGPGDDSCVSIERAHGCEPPRDAR